MIALEKCFTIDFRHANALFDTDSSQFGELVVVKAGSFSFLSKQTGINLVPVKSTLDFV